MINFDFAKTPRIIFGAGKIAMLPKIIKSFGNTVLFVLGGSSFRNSERCETLKSELKKSGITYYMESFKGEPSPEFVDKVSSEYKGRGVSVVAAIGGGSVVDAGKAVSAMITQSTSVVDFLEDVGTGAQHDGRKIPFIAVSTTAGTGSEATKNAVISSVGADGFKKSLRHDNFIPDIALVDPELMTTCPAAVTAACGLDSFTQLLEAYVSTKANPVTDSLALSGLRQFSGGTLIRCIKDPGNIELRTSLAYASLMSGIVLANAGLGVVHGIASPMGGFFDIPHGVVCGTLLGASVEMNVEKLKKENPAAPALQKYAEVSAMIFPDDSCTGVISRCERLAQKLNDMVNELEIPSLGKYGITENDLVRIAENSDNKNNPVKLTKDEIISLMRKRLS